MYCCTVYTTLYVNKSISFLFIVSHRLITFCCTVVVTRLRSTLSLIISYCAIFSQYCSSYRSMSRRLASYGVCRRSTWTRTCASRSSGTPSSCGARPLASRTSSSSSCRCCCPSCRTRGSSRASSSTRARATTPSSSARHAHVPRKSTFSFAFTRYHSLELALTYRIRSRPMRLQREAQQREFALWSFSFTLLAQYSLKF